MVFVKKLPEPAAVLWKEHSFQMIIFQDRGLYLLFRQLPCIAGVLTVRIGVKASPVSLVDLIVLIQIKLQIILEHKPSHQIRHGRRSAQLCFPDLHFFKI